MTILSKPLRRQLETAIKQAREIAEDAAREAISRMGVAASDAPAHLSENNKTLRRRLRAHARTLGDTRDAAGAMTTTRLQDAASYEIWHRMLFGRFLAERGLLIHPELGVAISVVELRDLAKEEGAADEWALAERYAAPGLPGVFKPDDPVLALPIAPEFSKRLRTVLTGLPEEVFAAEDSLGWTYQFWRASEKDAVNAAGGKIGASELPAVTQLFTESYMVKFLLHNTLGAWWAGKVLTRNPDIARNASDEDILREACALPGVSWEFMRFVRDSDGKSPWRPAAGAFPGWPKSAAEITYCDPCCGSGHFLVEALGILVALRQIEENLSIANSIVAVLRDNLHGLEIDGRCVQIATFNVALAAWKLAGLVISLPSPHIAWVGAPPPMNRIEMTALGNGDVSLRGALEQLHDQFVQAPLLGTLIKVGARDLLDTALREKGSAALLKLRQTEPERAEGAVAARGLFDAVDILSRRYTLQTTNVPFLAKVKQSVALAKSIEQNFPNSKSDLATAMMERLYLLSSKSGTTAIVSPQNWLYQDYYTKFRDGFLGQNRFNFSAALGAHAFDGITGEVVGVSLTIYSRRDGQTDGKFFSLNANDKTTPNKKSIFLSSEKAVELNQNLFALDKKKKISFDVTSSLTKLNAYATFHLGICTGDYERFGRKFPEVPKFGAKWALQQTTTSKTQPFRGFENALLWEGGSGALFEFVDERMDGNWAAWLRGKDAWGRRGILVSATGDLHVSFYNGDLFDSNSVVVIPKDPDLLAAVWSYMSDSSYPKAVRGISQALKVQGDLIRVGFDATAWNDVASTQYLSGLPEPNSDDPTQWLFHGNPAFAEPGTELQVALARLAGYHWPAEQDTNLRLSDITKQRVSLAAALPSNNADGLLTLRPSGNKPSLADRMREFLAAAYGAPVSRSHEQALIRAADARLDKKDAKDLTLEGWLADRAFRQHISLFHQRPFLWHVWDGMKNGFSAFLHYHQLDRSALDTLTYTLLGDWIRTAKAEGNTARFERAEQLQQKLAKIIQGESPYDIFVRWKPLAEQPFGWDPDLDDGVRLNIRPFMTAGILRDQPKGISWNKDRGGDMTSAPWYDLGPQYGGKLGDRINDHHTTLAEKRAARGTS